MKGDGLQGQYIFGHLQTARLAFLLGLLLSLSGSPLNASENVPHRPFAQWADVPAKGQFVVGIVYEESEAYEIWANRQERDITVHKGGEPYGIDINQGYVALQYGITERWAADLNLGFTTAGWRSFSPGNSIEDTMGLMDWAFGARYQIWNEACAGSPWIPTLTFRAGAVMPGTYNKDLPFSPGLRAAAIEPELLLRKHFGWPGLGVYGDALYRWNKTTHTDQYIVAAGFFQQIKGWEIDIGYLHMQTITGDNITFEDPDQLSTINYPRAPREINDSIQAGFSYTTKAGWRFGFHTRKVLDGSNTDSKFWVGGSIDIPLGGKRKEEPLN